MTRFASTSGGMFSVLALQMYKQGGYVGGAIFDEGWMVSKLISNDKSYLEKIRGSKLHQSNSQGFYEKVRDLLKTGVKVLVCGIPCQMAALKSFLKKDYENLIIVDLICRGINSPKVFSKWLSFLEDEYGAKVQLSCCARQSITLPIVDAIGSGMRLLTSGCIVDTIR